MASETVPCGATIYSLPRASADPVRQERRRGRLPRSIPNLRRYRTQKSLAASDASRVNQPPLRNELDEARARLADAMANLKVVGMLLQELELVAAEDR